MADMSTPSPEKQESVRDSTAKEKEQMGSRWSSPLVLAVLAATLGLAGNIWVEHANNKWKKDTDLFNVQSSLILDAIRTGDQQAACQNLRLLIGLGYLDDKNNTVKTQCHDVGPAPPCLPSSDKAAQKAATSQPNGSSNP